MFVKYRSCELILLGSLHAPTNSYLSMSLLYHKSDSVSSEIFGVAECEIIHFMNCEILLLDSNVKWNKSPHAPQRISHAKRISRTKCISQIPQGIYFVEKSTHLSIRQMCAFFWRRRRDSNSRTVLPVTRFPVVRPRPTRRLLHILFAVCCNREIYYSKKETVCQ